MNEETNNWLEANQAYLMARLQSLRLLLERHVERSDRKPEDVNGLEAGERGNRNSTRRRVRLMKPAARLRRLRRWIISAMPVRSPGSNVTCCCYARALSWMAILQLCALRPRAIRGVLMRLSVWR
jgi:hypothetical protein